MKTSRPMASPRVLTRETVNTEVQTAKQRPDRANSAHSAKHICSESRRMIAVIAILVAVVSVTCAAMPVFAQLPQGLTEALENQKAGRLKEAVEIYTEVIAKDPRSAEAYNWRGMAYEDLGQLDQALADFNKAIEISPDYADAYNNRGEIYRKKNTIPQAFADYRKAAELDKNFAEPHYNMGLMNEIQKKDGLAAGEYETYLKLRPDAADKQQILDKIEALKKTAATQPAPPPPAAEKKPGERPGVPKALPEKKAGEVPGVQKALPEKKAGEVPGVPKALPEKKAGERPGVPKPGMPMKPPTPLGGVDLDIPGFPQIPVSPDMLAAMAAGRRGDRAHNFHPFLPVSRDHALSHCQEDEH